MPESIRLFALCEAMKWAHLPVAGGLYDQHPQLLDDWIVIFNRRAAKDRAEREARDRKNR